MQLSGTFFLLRHFNLWHKKLELTQSYLFFYLVSFVEEAFVLIFKIRFVWSSDGMTLISEHAESCSDISLVNLLCVTNTSFVQPKLSFCL